MRRWAEVRVAHHPDSAKAWGIRCQRWVGRRAALHPGWRQDAEVRADVPWKFSEHLVGEARQIRLIRQ